MSKQPKQLVGHGFQPGVSANPGGRPKGRIRLTKDFLDALAQDFAEHGAGAIRIMRIERPSDTSSAWLR
jgi:hypothetical protein